MDSETPYAAPTIRSLEVTVETGFAASATGTNDPFSREETDPWND